jgi:hypothetical protein
VNGTAHSHSRPPRRSTASSAACPSGVDGRRSHRPRSEKRLRMSTSRNCQTEAGREARDEHGREGTVLSRDRGRDDPGERPHGQGGGGPDAEHLGRGILGNVHIGRRRSRPRTPWCAGTVASKAWSRSYVDGRCPLGRVATRPAAESVVRKPLPLRALSWRRRERMPAPMPVRIPIVNAGRQQHQEDPATPFGW